MDRRSLGVLIMVAGLAIAVVGLAIFSGALSWFGRLLGDVRIEGRNVKIYAPLVSILLLSLGLSLFSPSGGGSSDYGQRIG